MEWIDELARQVRKRTDPWIVLEGKHAVEGAIGGWWDVQGILAAEDCEWTPPVWSGRELTRVARTMIEEVADHRFHHGVLGLAKLPEERADVAALVGELGQDARVVVCPSLADAATAGAMVRNAAALGAQAVIFGDEGVSPYTRKAVRASGGALFRIPVRVADGGQVLRCLKAGKFALIGAHGGEDASALPEHEWTEEGRVALVIGNEERGLNGFWRRACDSLVKIPVNSGVDSLNAAAALALLLWEMKKARE